VSDFFWPRATWQNQQKIRYVPDIPVASLVGGFNPPEKYDFVSWDDDIPNCFWKVINFHGSSHHQPDYGNFINPTVKPQCFFSDLWKQPYEVAKRSGMANNYEVGL